LTAVLISRYGWRHMFLIVGAAALLWLVPWLAAFPSRLPHQDPARPVQVAASPSGREKRLVTFDRNLLGICLANFSEGYFFYVLVTWLPDYLMTVRHLPLVRAGLYTALPYLIFAVSMPLGGWISDRLIRLGWDETVVRKTIVTLAYLSGLLLIPATHVQSSIGAIWLIAGASLPGFGVANLFVFSQCCAPEHEVGTWIGGQNFIGNMGGVAAPLATGFLIARTGSYSAGFALGAWILVAGIFPVWFVLGELKLRWRAQHVP